MTLSLIQQLQKLPEYEGGSGAGTDWIKTEDAIAKVHAVYGDAAVGNDAANAGAPATAPAASLGGTSPPLTAEAREMLITGMCGKGREAAYSNPHLLVADGERLVMGTALTYLETQLNLSMKE